MASVTPRASGFWADSTRNSYFSTGNDDDNEVDAMQEQLEADADSTMDERTPLDKTIDRIGMGSYQWTLLSLCGFGWMADNMWMEAVAIALPRVQQHYNVSDRYIGAVSSSMFLGMMCGAVGWGSCSDLLGRAMAFNLTLCLTAVFGLLTTVTHSFTVLCIVLFFLGTAVGGSMPTDGTLLLEHMPNGKHHLVTALSVFFSFGAVLSALVALAVIPQNSCAATTVNCDVDVDNMGWKYMFGILGILTLLMFLARIVFFRLHESPRYLVHAGRPREALESLQLISQFNGTELELDLEDVKDEPMQPYARYDVEEGDVNEEDTALFLAREPTRPPLPDFDRDESSEPTLEGRTSFSSQGYNSTMPSPPKEETSTTSQSPPPSGRAPRLPRPRPPIDSRQSLSRASLLSRRESMYGSQPKGRLDWLKRPILNWLRRVAYVLQPKWFRTTIIVWTIWLTMSLAYTMFNVFLPKLLESRGAGDDISQPKPLKDTLWDVVIFTLAGCPAPLIGAWMVNSSIGRRLSLAGSTFVTALFCIMFSMVKSSWAVRASTVGISLSATTMYAVLYGWTPEIFDTKVRGTAGGIASALSRIGGMVAPIIGGSLLMINTSFPVYASILVFAFSALCVLFISEDAGAGGKKDVKTFVH